MLKAFILIFKVVKVEIQFPRRCYHFHIIISINFQIQISISNFKRCAQNPKEHGNIAYEEHVKKIRFEELFSNVSRLCSAILCFLRTLEKSKLVIKHIPNSKNVLSGKKSSWAPWGDYIFSIQSEYETVNFLQYRQVDYFVGTSTKNESLQVDFQLLLHILKDF